MNTGIKKSLLISGITLLLAGTACTPGEPVDEVSVGREGPPRVYAVNYPLTYFAERIGGDRIAVVLPAPADVDPATWTPTADEVAAFQQADLVLLNGAGYSGWVQRVTLSESRLVDTSAAFGDRLIPVEDDVTHSHGPAGDHSHSGTAFTTWLDLGLAIAHAIAVKEALSGLLPDDEQEFRARFGELEAELEALDDELQAIAARIGSQPLLFSHPVYQYLARRYSLNGHAVHWEPGELPTEAQWRELSAILASHEARWMLWEGEPLAESVQRLREMGVESLVFSPCSNRPVTGDFLSAMRQNLQALAQVAP